MDIEKKTGRHHRLTPGSLTAFIGLFWLIFLLGDVLIHGMGPSISTSF
jgi:hypothetical protein